MKSDQTKFLESTLPHTILAGVFFKVCVHRYKYRVVCFRDCRDQCIRTVCSYFLSKQNRLIASLPQRAPNRVRHALIYEEPHCRKIGIHAASEFLCAIAAFISASVKSGYSCKICSVEKPSSARR